MKTNKATRKALLRISELKIKASYLKDTPKEYLKKAGVKS